MIWLIC